MLRREWELYGDAALALVFFAATAALIATDDALDTADKLGAFAVAAAVAVSIWQRKRAPLLLAAALLVSFLLRPLIEVGGEGVTYGLVALVGAYTCAAHLDGRERRVGALLTAANAVVLTLIDGENLEGAIFYALLFGAPWAAGRVIRLSRSRQVLLEEQAVLLEHQRDEQARMAVADERRRIARELHDVVAHAISVVVVQARGGRKVLATEPGAAREAFDTIESTSTQALGEMRRLLGLLRAEDDQPFAPQPTLDRLEELADELRGSGLPVEVTIDGERGPLPPGVDVSAYRIVQEALTNALKHAGPARARVRVSYEPDGVVVEVTDDGGGDSDVTAPALPGSGHGLVGIRERVAVVGGQLTAGPAASGGFAVKARLPFADAR